MSVPEPFLQFEQRQGLTCVEELRGDGRARAVAGNAPARIFEGDTGLPAESRDECHVQVLEGEATAAKGEQKVNYFAGFII